MKRALFAFCIGLMTLPLTGQELRKIDQFTSLDKEVQVLPGPIVVVQNDIADGTDKILAFQSGKFHQVTANILPPAEKWSSFNWADVDVLDQVDRADFDVSLADLVPPGSKIKGFATIAGFISGEEIAFVCYGAPLKENVSLPQRDLHVLMLSTLNNSKKRYKKQADLLVAEESAFGSLVLEREPAGIFVALYSTSIGGASHRTNSVDILLLTRQTSLQADRATTKHQ